MRRRSHALPVLLVAVALAAGACGNAGPALTDPVEILTKSVDAIQDVKTVHLEATVEGTVKLDLMGAGQAGDVSLTGTKLTADIDIEGGDLAASVAVPAFLGLTADMIVVDDATFTRVSLSGDKYVRGQMADLGFLTNPTDIERLFAELRTWLALPELEPEKLDDTSCGSKSCYQVQVDLNPAEILSLLPEGSPIMSTALQVTVLVEKDSLRPAGFVVLLADAEIGQVSLTLNLTKWDDGLDIQAPPADEIQ